MSRLAEDSWLPAAKRLAEGERKYINHTCGGGKTLVVSADDKGWSGHCFRCNADGFIKYGIRPLADLGIIRKAEQSFQYSSKVALPDDFTNDIPPEYFTWLSKCSIFRDTAKAYNFGWSASMQRIILPIYKDGELIFMQARAVESWRKPKYLNLSAVPKTKVLFRSSGYDTVRVCCITEDMASAVRVGMYVPAVSTLGTSLSPEQAAQITDSFDYAFIWYDADGAGRKGDVAAKRILRMLGMSCYSICTSKDAKLHTNHEITELLTKGRLDGRNRPHYPTDYEGEGFIREDVPELALRLFR